ncbi:hypothetical protein AA313_de0210091 [Arthrobotrys entomopaga]|nr:hypothetical protein AA313_de0210091 [Arthrobotrys entomopaga]
MGFSTKLPDLTVPRNRLERSYLQLANVPRNTFGPWPGISGMAFLDSDHLAAIRSICLECKRPWPNWYQLVLAPTLTRRETLLRPGYRTSLRTLPDTHTSRSLYVSSF